MENYLKTLLYRVNLFTSAQRARELDKRGRVIASAKMMAMKRLLMTISQLRFKVF